MLIRAESADDQAAIYSIDVSAFETSAEADLVDTLRGQAEPFISPVAEDAGAVVGHIMFTPVSLSTDAEFKVMGLAPVAVLPEHQRRGIGAHWGSAPDSDVW